MQTRHWRSNETLFQHAVHVSTNNAIAQYNLALTFQIQGRWAEAIRHYREAIRAHLEKEKRQFASRLKRQMRLCDMLYFQAEHDLHHLNRISEMVDHFENEE